MMTSIFRRSIFSVVAAVAILFSAGTTRAVAQSCGDVPDDGFAVTAPSAAAGAAAGFTGLWTGTWTIEVGLRARDKHNATYCTKLHVAVRDARSAAVMYCSAALPEARIPKFCAKLDAKIAGNVLSFTTRSNYTYTFTLADPATMHGQFISAFHASEQRAIETDFHK